jgi:Gnt-I system low-affinity gluconate transporter
MLSEFPFVAVAVAVGLLLTLILWLRLQAFVALLVASLFFAVIVGMPLGDVTASVVDGMGKSLGLVATLIGLGAIFGAMLEHSGGAQTLAHRMVGAFGAERAPWALVLAGFMISVPVFLDVGLVILAPLLVALARAQRKPVLAFGLPFLAGMAVTHAFVPPTPGPIIVAENIGADLGWVILFGSIVGLPAAIIAGPLWAKWIVPRLKLPVPPPEEAVEHDHDAQPVSFALVTGLIGLPILLIVAASVADTVIGKDSRAGWHEWLAFAGHPIVALILATLLAMWLLGARRGVGREEIVQLATKALGPAGVIILVTGAGGVFKQVLVDSGVGEQLAQGMAGWAVGPITLAWLLAAVVRVTQGSATVSMIAASALMAPILEPMALGQADLALVTVAIAAGATTLSHVNDSGFWLISRYLGLTEKQTLKSWSVATVIISLLGWLGALALSAVV